MRYLITLCLLLFASLTTIAQTTQPAAQQKTAEEAQLEKLDAIVNLTDEQKDKLRKTFSATALEYRNWVKYSQAEYKRMQPLMIEARKKSDKQAINDLLIELNKVRKQGITIRAKMREQTLAVLTKDQIILREADTLSSNFLKFMKTLVVMEISDEQVAQIKTKAKDYATKMQGIEPQLKHRVLLAYRDAMVKEVFTKEQQEKYTKAMAIKRKMIEERNKAKGQNTKQ